MSHLLRFVLQTPPPVRTVPGDEGQILRSKSHGPEEQQGRAVAPGPVHQQDPPSLHPEQGHSAGPAQGGEAAVQHHVAGQLSSAGSSPHSPAHKLEQERDGDELLEAIEAGARDELGLHRGSKLLVEYAVDGAEEEAHGEEDDGDQSEEEAGSDAFIHPGVGDGGVGLAVALDEHHGCSWRQRQANK